MDAVRVIAITGLRRSGKDEIAKVLGEKWGFDNVKVAGPLKQVIMSLFNMTEDHVEGHMKDVIDERWGITPRLAMQFIGTEVMQYKIQEIMPHIGRNFWMKKLCDLIKANPNKLFAISDVRFLHEVSELKKAFPNQVCVVKVIRPSLFAGEECDTHSSELEWQHIQEDILITNDGDLDSLRAKIYQL